MNKFSARRLFAVIVVGVLFLCSHVHAQDQWSEVEPGFNLDGVYISSVAYGVNLGTGKGIFVAVILDDTGNVDDPFLWSEDGNSWTRVEVLNARKLTRVRYGNGRFVAVGGHGIWVSTDGKTWSQTLPDSLPLHNYHFQNVEYGGGTGWVAMNWDDSQWGNVSWQSVDGVVWTEGDVMRPPGGPNRGVGLAATESLHVHTCDGGYTGRSADGLNWSHTANSGMSAPDNAAYGNGKVLALNGDPSEVFASLDGGQTWTKQSFTFPYRLYSRLGFYNGVFLALGNRPTSSDHPRGIWYSPDGVDWTSASVVPETDFGGLQDACFGDGKFVVVGYKTIWVSPDRNNTVHSHDKLGKFEYENNDPQSGRMWVQGLCSWLGDNGDDTFQSKEFGRFSPGNDALWISSSVFGWTHFGTDAAQYDGWVHTERFGWMKFVYPGDDTTQTPFLYVPMMNSWMSVNGDGRFYSFQWGHLTPEGLNRYQSSIFGGLTTGDFGGWVYSDRFGWMWANGDGTWYWSETRKEWLGVTADGGIWSTAEGSFL